MDSVQSLVGKFAKSIETGWVGKVLSVDVDGCDEDGYQTMLKMAGSDWLSRVVGGASLEASVDYDDIQWFSVDDVLFLNHKKVKPAPAKSPRFANVYCSQCGREFGPGDHGYSACKSHTKGVHSEVG